MQEFGIFDNDGLVITCQGREEALSLLEDFRWLGDVYFKPLESTDLRSGS